MTREELEELHYITPIANLPSIVSHGILSHRRAAEVTHTSIAMTEVQKLRAKVTVPGGRSLHEYANLYICARNPMMFVRRGQHREICVVRVRTDVLDIPGTVVTDGNASSSYTAFRAAPAGLNIVDKADTFAEKWTDANLVEYWRKKAAKCAEVLVPDRVDPQYITGVYVSGDEARQAVAVLGLGLATQIDPKMFFR